MEPVVVCCAIIIAIICLLTTVLIKNAYQKKKRPNVVENRAQRAPVIVGGRRQTTVRRRNVGAEQRQPIETEYGGEEGSDEDANIGSTMFDIDDVAKMGKKKAAKLQAKAEKRSQREAELEEREERRRREVQKAQQQKEKEDAERQTELEREEAERRAKEEKERREYEEYLQLKQAFSVENEGFDVDESADAENMLKDFVDFVKKTKVVSIDELASRWNLRPQDAVDRIKTLVADGTLTGVVDDRGKFIYITPEELNSVAKFINQRGRVSVAELVDYSNRLINLEPDSSVATEG